MKKILAFCLTLALILSCMVFPAGAEATKDGRRVVEFWHCFGGSVGDAMLDIVNKFNNSQDEIWVEASFQGNYEDTLTKLKAALPNGNGPDVFQMFELGTAYLSDTDFYVPFQDLLEKDPYVSLDDIEGVLRNYYTVDGKMVCMPINPSSPIMYYNKTLFDKAGITEIPTTWDEIAAIADKLTSVEGGAKYAFGMYTYGWFFENYLAGMGKNYVNNDNGHTATATAIEFDQNGGGKAVMEKWKELSDAGVLYNFGAAGSDACETSFMSGQTAITLFSTAALQEIMDAADFEVGVAYLPKIVPESEGGVIIGGGNLWITKNEDEQQVKDAWEFVKFATSPESSTTFCMATGYFAANTNAYKVERYAKYLEENPNATVALNQLHDSPKNYATAGARVGVMTELREVFQTVMDEYLQGAYTVEDALAEMAAQDNSAIEIYNETQSLK